MLFVHLLVWFKFYFVCLKYNIIYNNTRLKGLIKLDSDSVVINSYPCFLIDKIVPMRNRL